jgi:hypothetical protein
MKSVFSHQNMLYFLLFGALLTYITARAIVIPITVDEGCTILSQITKDTYEIVNFEKDSSINNHIFNTLCIKFFLFTTGMNTPLLTRLPNILAFCLGFFYGVKLLRAVSNNNIWMTLLGIALVFFNPYYLEFCSLARGYGMSVNFSICSIYFIYKYLIDNQLKDICVGLCFAALGVYANFSAEHLYAALVIYLLLHLFFAKDMSKKWQALAMIVGISSALLLVIFKPLRAIMKANQLQFFGHSNFYQDTIKTFVGCSMHESKYMGASIFDPFSLVVMLLYVVLCIFIVVLWRKRTDNLSKNAFFFFFWLLTLVILSCNVQHYALNIAFMTSRTTLLFVPLVGFAFWEGINEFFQSFNFPKKSILIGIFIWMGGYSFNFLHNANLNSAYEWWFDADTYRVYGDLQKEQATHPEKLLYFGVQNLYQASFEYHRMTKYNNIVHPVLWLYNIPTNNEFEYLYVSNEIYDKMNLKTHYNILKNYNTNERFLLKRKDMP